MILYVLGKMITVPIIIFTKYLIPGIEKKA